MSRPDGGAMWASLLHMGVPGGVLGAPHVPVSELKLPSGARGVGFYGVPWDATAVGRSGASHGPRGVREASTYFMPYCATTDLDLSAVFDLVDCGDALVVPANAARTFEHVRSDIAAIMAASCLPVVFGGDHSVTIPVIEAVVARHGEVGLIVLDSHLDTAEHVAGERLSSCSPVRRAVEAGVDPGQIVILGANGWLNPRDELAYCRDQGITIVWLDEIRSNGTSWAIERARETAGRAPGGTYLTVDMDALDAAYATGTCVPTAGGMTSGEAIEIVRGVVTPGLVGLDVVEIAPMLDPSGATASMAMRLTLEALAATVP